VQLVEIFAELCNKTLHQEILEGEDFGFMDKVAIAKDIAGALAYLHKNGFSHNDIKPDNILIKYKKEGRSVGKLADFGMTRSINSAGAGFTKIYAPEQRDQKEKDKIYNDKTDVYQFGLLLWHMFHPNPPDHHLDIGFAYPHSEDLFLDWDCDSTDEITMMGFIGRCLEENPAKRPSMKEIEEFLSRF
jgi:serine/threonine protein kinase